MRQASLVIDNLPGDDGLAPIKDNAVFFTKPPGCELERATKVAPEVDETCTAVEEGVVDGVQCVDDANGGMKGALQGSDEREPAWVALDLQDPSTVIALTLLRRSVRRYGSRYLRYAKLYIYN